MIERTRPSALCSACGAISYDIELINTVCNAPLNGKKCGGYWQKRDRMSDWKNCSRCAGIGYIDEKGCDNCQRSGWESRR